MASRTVEYGPFDPLPRIIKTSKSRRLGGGLGFVVNVKVVDYSSTSTTRDNVYFDWYRSAVIVTVTLPLRQFKWYYLFTNSKRSRTMPWAHRHAEIKARRAIA